MGRHVGSVPVMSGTEQDPSPLAAFLTERLTDDEDLARSAAETALTLTDFLLARIAEDEYHYGPLLSKRLETTLEPARTWLEAARKRVLAECEAKRKIIEAFTALDGEALAAMRAGSVDAAALAQVAATALQEHAIRPLASAHADHPDFRPEWRL